MEYHAQSSAGKVKIAYQIYQGEMEKLDYQSESLLPVYDAVFTKEFILYQVETLKYYFKETQKDRKIVSEKEVKRLGHDICAGGKFGLLNQMSVMSEEEKKVAMEAYQREEEIAGQIFQVKRLGHDICAGGKFGLLNQMSVMSEEEKKVAMEAYQREEEIAGQIFQTY